MTAEVAVLNKGAVALAADSKTTIRIKGILKSNDTENKLFTLSKFHPVGIMINGNAEFMQRPWETIIKLYRDSLRDKCLRTLEEYAEDFLFGLENDHDFLPEEQQSNTTFLLLDFLSAIKRRADEFVQKGATTEDALTRAVDAKSRVDLALPDLECMKGITAEAIRDLYEPQINSVVEALFEKADSEQRRKLILYAETILLKNKFSAGESEIIIAGYGDQEIFPSIKSYRIDGIVAGRIRQTTAVECKITTLGMTAAIFPFAQREMVDRFLNGIDSGYGSYLRRGLTRILRGTAKELIDQYAAGTAAEKDEIAATVDDVITEKLKGHFSEATQYRRTSFSEPIIDMTEQLPKEELAHLAESLVNLTSFKRRVSLDHESVGGPIDVAVISKGDGFVWIKRKHYFDPALNIGFSKNYFRSHIKADGETAHERHARKESVKVIAN
jgi:hypothetical protein